MAASAPVWWRRQCNEDALRPCLQHSGSNLEKNLNCDQPLRVYKQHWSLLTLSSTFSPPKKVWGASKNLRYVLPYLKKESQGTEHLRWKAPGFGQLACGLHCNICSPKRASTGPPPWLCWLWFDDGAVWCLSLFFVTFGKVHCFLIKPPYKERVSGHTACD